MNGQPEPIAIIGLAGRFPGARDTEAFWHNLRDGRESVRFPSDEELTAAGVPAQALSDPDYVKAVAAAPGIDEFDARFFDMSPRDATATDPQIRIFLEAAHAALENAGYDPSRISDVGVFGSVGVNRYVDLLTGSDHNTVRSASGMSVGVLNNSDYVATLVSYKFNFRGPAMTVQTACSSSLLAVHLAAQALRGGECELALAGGSDVEFPLGHGHWWAPGSPMTPDGHCRPFDKDANGTIFGSGAGVVVLKRLSDALADGDTIRAVVRATAVNNDGSGKVGFSAPSVAGQSAVVAEALEMAGVHPAEISYVEAHATGTPLGDPIEVTALTQAYQRLAGGDLETGGCVIGSVKGNVGHLGHASGVTSLIKVVLSLENEQIPQTVNCAEPNPKLGLESSPFRVATGLTGWPRTPGAPRLAGVSSLGIGGTNVHAVVEEGPAPAPAAQEERERLVVWSGKDPQAEREYRTRLAGHFERVQEDAFADTVATLQHGRTAHLHRAALVATGAGDAAAALAEPGAPRVVTGRGAAVPREVAFLLPGQGAQHAAMARGLYGTEKAFTRALDECLDLLDAHDPRIRRIWRGAATDEELRDTTLAQPLLFAVDYAVSRMWLSWGVRPAVLLGHSIGELAAAAVAEVFSLADGAALVATRARAMGRVEPGGMLAVSAPAGTVEGLLPAGLTLAVVNGPQQSVVAGRLPVLEDFAAALRAEGISSVPVRTSHAFHSPMMAAAAEEFERAFDGVELRAPRLPIRSAATGRLITDQEAMTPAFWSRQLVDPVRFGPALDALLAEQDHLLLEVGPGRTLTSLVARHPAAADGRHLAVASLPGRRGDGERADWRSVVDVLAVLWTEGHPVDWNAVGQHEPVRRVPVPGYPYRPVRHWVDAAPPRGTAAASGTSGVSGTAAQDGAELPAPDRPARPETAGTPFTTLSWVDVPREAGPRAPRHTPALVMLPADPDRATEVSAALQQAGLRITRVQVGTAYEESGTAFRLRPGAAEDVERMFRTLAGRGNLPRLLVHAQTLDPLGRVTSGTVHEQLEGSFHSLVTLVQQGVRHTGRQGMPALLVLTENSVDVSGAESVDPVRAMAHGLVRTIALEDERIVCKLVDIGTGVAEDALVAELSQWQMPGVVALRGDRRWQRTEQEYHPLPASRPALRRGGVYLITGGLGGLGMEVAKGLARTGLRPRLVLLGRTGLPEGEERRRLLAVGDPRTTRLTADLRELAAAGAEYRVFACDVTETRALRRVADIAVARFGPISGVLHLAGVAGDGMLAFRDREQTSAVLAPKVRGTLALAELFADRPQLDFFVSFSSRASVMGLTGGGDYAAANSFLDAFTGNGLLGGCRVLSVNWPAWNTVGMAVPALAAGQARPVAAARVWRTELTPAEYPALDEHRVSGKAVLPGTGHLDLIVRAFRAEVLGGRPAPVRLADVVFLRPLVVEDRCQVEISWEPEDGTADRWRFTVASTTGENGRRQVHARGTAGESTGVVERVDLAGLRARHTQRRAKASGGRRPQRLFSLGPRWNNVVAVDSVPGDRGEHLVELALPEVFAQETADHALHPALLDSATSHARDPERDSFHLPFMYHSLTLNQESVPDRFLSHIRRQDSADGLITADVTLLGEDGQVIADIEGFTMRRVADAGFLDVAPAPTAEAGSAGSAPLPAVPQDGAPTVQSGIDPETGTRLLLELLDSATPRQVAVAPFHDGVPLGVAVPRAPVPRPEPATVQVVAAVPVAPAAARDLAVAPPVGVLVPADTRPTSAPAPVPDSGPAGTDPVEERLRELWKESLGAEAISAEDDFFELGGNSLTAVELMSQIRKQYALDLSIAALFDYPTLHGLAAELRTRGAR
ncbi:SDR family NAD(P)-dependent oxidoreductase [Kitasatospora sp. NPDC056651]|uniref:type I polyketide synthase n=1 Tax=Kitasatospora sp. NPDC056651 TaxID=3345892 RepID=UPI0036775688